VPGFGDPHARVLIIGLAPAAHGANRTGRMFTGDSSGDFLYAALHRAGFASQPTSRRRDDGLALNGVFISAACRCAPPDNKPLPDEIAACRPFLEQEIALLSNLRVVVALGRIAFDLARRLFAIQSVMPGLASHEISPPRQVEDSGAPNKFGALLLPGQQPLFAHAATYPLVGGRWLVASYHPSRQNTQTGRLTAAMFDRVWARVGQMSESANQQVSASQSLAANLPPQPDPR